MSRFGQYIPERFLGRKVCSWLRASAALAFVLLCGCGVLQQPENGKGSDPAATARRPNRSAIAGDQRVGVWISNVGSDVLSSKTKLRALLLDLKQMGVNTLYPVVWNRGYAIGPSVVARNALGTGQMPEYVGTDPLAWIFEIINEERLGFEVIGWFEYGLKVPFEISPAGQVAREKGWLLVDEQGGDTYVTGGSKKRTLGFLNPFHEGVQSFVRSFVHELLQRYPQMVGVQIDDNFSVLPEMGYNPSVVASFHEFLRERKLDQYRLDARLTQQQDLELRERLWKGFRIDGVRMLAQIFFETARAVRPQVIAQVSPAGTIGFSYNLWLQDWRYLVHNYVVDEFVVQAYRNDLQTFEAVLRDSSVTVSRGRLPAGVGIFSGYKESPAATAQIVAQARKAREMGFGISFFFQESLLNPGASGGTKADRIAALRGAIAL